MRAFISPTIALLTLLVATTGAFRPDLAAASSFDSPEAEVRAALTAPPQGLPEELPWRGSLLELYRQRGFTPLWFSGVHPTRQAIELTSELRRAEERGLRSS